MPRITKNDLENKISELEQEKQDVSEILKSERQDFVNQKIEIEKKHKEEIKGHEENFNLQIEEIEEKLENLENENKEKQQQLDKRELKKFAQAYRDQEIKYKKEIDRWTNFLAISFFLLLISALLSVFFTSNKIWYERIQYYAVDFIFISIVWFCATQYSYYVKLRSDFANRKTLAQSYHNIINSTGDEVIKDKFLDKATGVLCTKNDTKELKDGLLTKQLTKDIIEVTKNLSKAIK